MVIPLRSGERVLIDVDDYEKVSDYRWYYFRGTRPGVGYASTVRKIDGKNKSCFMHRLIMGAQSGIEVDHINGDGLDNRKQNLRLCNKSQQAANTGPNRCNTSGYKGVSFCRRENKWRSYITHNSKFRSLGYYETKEEAAFAYNEAARGYFGEFAYQNEVKEVLERKGDK
jgi:hypothetical protein